MGGTTNRWGGKRQFFGRWGGVPPTTPPLGQTLGAFADYIKGSHMRN